MDHQLKRRLSLIVIALFLGACGGGGSSSSGAVADGGDTPAGGTAAGDSTSRQETITTASGSQVVGDAGLEGFEAPDQVTVLETR